MNKAISTLLIHTILLTTTIFGWTGEMRENCDVYQNSKPSQDDTTQCSLKAGDLVKVVKTKGDMYKIKIYTGCTGYVQKNHVKHVPKGRKLEPIKHSERSLKLLEDINLRLKRRTLDSTINFNDIL